ncbi:hypothetical protein [Streptomyces noursei]|uniref:Uncharacterized protein n=1 Tax=Streptomyces noursei TaxID=1971 RepID=A0A2N8P848_STRNR|nr:hypothetical protein [Streptomyces noursei]PNE37182.1 hypothetical protein AOB60_22590 [Streptomyces noursei]
MTDSVLHQTIQNLEGVLPTLEEQERHLRNQLDDVVQRATSARSALEHLRVLTGAELADRQPVTAGSVSAEAPAEAAGTAVQEAAGDNHAADAVAAAPVAAEPETEAEPAVEASVVPQPRTATSPRTKRRPAKKAAAAAKKPAAAKPKAKKAAAKRTVAEKQPVAQDKESGSLLDAALDVLKNSGAPMRPRDINEALGRESTPGQIESVRNTLDRAVKKTDLVTRPGRGTYAAA